MSSYVIVGASRGIGFEMMRQLSENPENIVIGLVRSVEQTKRKVIEEIGRSNIHIYKHDLDDPQGLLDTVEAVSELTGGKLDCLIANAATGYEYAHYSIGDLAKEPDLFDREVTNAIRVNALGSANAIGAFMPLILRGSAKKVIAITTGLCDIDLTRNHDVWMSVPYCMSKAALNVVVAKFSAEYREKGVLVLGISPGVVMTNTEPSKHPEMDMALGGKLMAFEPTWKGPISTEESVEKVLSVVEKSTLNDGNAGDMISHLGNKKWL